MEFELSSANVQTSPFSRMPLSAVLISCAGRQAGRHVYLSTSHFTAGIAVILSRRDRQMKPNPVNAHRPTSSQTTLHAALLRLARGTFYLMLPARH